MSAHETIATVVAESVSHSVSSVTANALLRGAT
jgi:hypothetical protein